METIDDKLKENPRLPNRRTLVEEARLSLRPGPRPVKLATAEGGVGMLCLRRGAASGARAGRAAGEPYCQGMQSVF